MEEKGKKFDVDAFILQLQKKSSLPVPLDLADPLVFAKLYAQTQARRDKATNVSLQHEGKPVCYLEVRKIGKYFEDNYLYCFSNEDEGMTWNRFGEELSNYSNEEIQLIVKTVLRIMRTDSRGNANDMDSDSSKTKELIAQVLKIKQKGDYPPLELLGQLIGASACEAGRGNTAHLNMFATFIRIKLFNEKGGTLADYVNNEIFPEKYDDTSLDKTRHATAFEKSQHIARVNSGREDLKIYNNTKYKNYDDVNEETNTWNKRYKKMLRRDITFISSDESLSESKKEKYKKESPEERINRRFTRHLQHTTTILNNLGPSNSNNRKEEKKSKEEAKFSSKKSGSKSEITMTDAFNKPISREENKWLYTDVDIATYTNAFINNNLNGYKKGLQYVLADRCKREDRDYIVAVTPPVRTKAGRGTNTPINYFFDKANFADSSMQDFIKQIEENEKMYNKIKSYYDNFLKMEDDPVGIREQYDGLSAFLMHEFDITAETANSMIDHINNHFSAKMDFKAIYKDIRSKKEGVDVLDEVLSGMDEQLSIDEIAGAKIIFPYNLNDAHWVTAEVTIHADIEDGKHKYNIQVCSHDPYGNGMMNKEEANLLYKTIRNRIRKKYSESEDIDVEIKGVIVKSPFNQRQNDTDGVSCGVIAARDLTLLIQGEDLDVENPYPNQALELRKHQLQYVQEYGDEKSNQFFLKRNQFLDKLLSKEEKRDASPVNEKDKKNKEDLEDEFSAEGSQYDKESESPPPLIPKKTSVPLKKEPPKTDVDMDLPPSQQEKKEVKTLLKKRKYESTAQDSEEKKFLKNDNEQGKKLSTVQKMQLTKAFNLLSACDRAKDEIKEGIYEGDLSELQDNLRNSINYLCENVHDHSITHNEKLVEDILDELIDHQKDFQRLIETHTFSK